jgi:hypothetical protein
MGRERRALAVLPERREEDLVRGMGVHRARDLGDAVEVGIQESRDAVVVLESASARSPPHVKRALRETEVALEVDEEEADMAPIDSGGGDAALGAPTGRLGEDRGNVRLVRPGRGMLGPVERGQGLTAHRGIGLLD